jgi:hypothetical protein
VVEQFNVLEGGGECAFCPNEEVVFLGFRDGIALNAGHSADDEDECVGFALGEVVGDDLGR